MRLPKKAKGEGTKPIHIEEKKNSGKTEEGKEKEARGESLTLLFASLRLYLTVDIHSCYPVLTRGVY